MALNDPFDNDNLGDVLIVDPNAFGRKLMTTMVAELGCRCTVVAENVTDALAALVADNVDLVIADHRPSMSAIGGLLRSLRQASEPHFQNMTVLSSTDGIDRGFVDTVGRIGVDGIVATPCSSRTLADRIFSARGIWHQQMTSAERPCAVYGSMPCDEEPAQLTLFPLPSR
ncbi:hypothetical protein [Breoghania sp.]|uniref:hypothetical protein n=1 Tax=Breoghania sp. TaxID=2065378 RepID=UPI00260BDFC2|nr:hypothetical protein [Breoghania sp.]MDJ0932483.1 hypothetical protein [Breoghania sp.]